MNTEIDRRRNPRIPMCWPVVMMTPQGAMRGITEDISMNGVLILSSELIETADEIDLIARLPQDYEMSITVKKIWSEALLSDDSVYYEIGSRFTKISPSDLKTVASLIEDFYLA